MMDKLIVYERKYVDEDEWLEVPEDRVRHALSNCYVEVDGLITLLATTAAEHAPEPGLPIRTTFAQYRARLSQGRQ